MHKTRNDLPPKVRMRSGAPFNARLASALDLHLAIRQACWSVKGPAFIVLHELFDQLAGQLAEAIDEMAERIVAPGGVAEAVEKPLLGAFSTSFAQRGFRCTPQSST